MKTRLLNQLQFLILLLFTIAFQPTLFAQVKIASVKVDKNTAYQKITGFGGFVNSPQFGYNHMTPAEIRQVWGAASQTGCNIMRIYIPTGEANWAQVIPTAQLAKSLGLKLFASPWSMPTEWKTVNIIGSQYDDAGVKKEVYLKPEHYADYAQYLNNFVLLLRNNGVELDAISLQNEPDWKADYAGCIWTPAQLTKFLKENSDAISCPVMVPETVGMSDSYANALLAPDVLPKFEIYGGHQYGGIGTAFKNLQAQGKELWMTEYLINWNESGASRNFDWNDAFTFAASVNNAMLANVNAWIHYAAKRFYGLMGDGQFGTTEGVITKRGRIFSHYAKYVTGSTRIQHAFNDNTASLTGSAYLSQTGDSVFVVVMNPSANTYSLAVDLPFLSTSGMTVKTTATEDMTAAALSFTETNRPTVTISPSSVTTLVFKKSGEYAPSQMVNEVVNYKKIETQTPTNAAFGTGYMLSGKTASFSNGSRLISTNTNAANGYLALDYVYNRLVFSVENLTSTLSYTSSNTTLNYINAAGAFKSYNYGTVNFDKRTNFDWVLDISPNVLTDTCKGIVSITNGNFSSILTFKFKNVFCALGTERGQSFSGPYSAYDGNLLDALADTMYTSYNFINATGIPALTNWYSTAVNKNAVFYTSAGTLSNETNVVSGTTANNLKLSDVGGDFYAPISFTANNAIYQSNLNGYKMLTLPFEAGIPDGVKAYTLSFAGSQINGTRITDHVIPANTPVLINGSGSFTFTGTGTILPLLNPRTGIATSVYIQVKAPVSSYYLTTVNGTTSFARATASVQPLVNPFEGYLSPAATAPNLPIVLDDGAAVSVPVITVSATSLNKLGYIALAGSPMVDSFTVSGTTLSQNVEITAPANFEVSLSAGSGYATSVSLASAGGALSPTTIYVRMVSGQAVNTYTGMITVSSTGAESKNVEVEGRVYAQAVVSTSETTITGLGYHTFLTVPSRVKSFFVWGGPLAGDITITASANFEISRTASSGFGNAVTLAIANGRVDTTIIYVRLKEGLAENSYNGNIVVASSTATDKKIALSGTANAHRIYDFTADAASTTATTPPAAGITVAPSNNATAGVVSYTDLNGNTSNRFRAYTGGNRNATGVMDLGWFPNNATDYAVTWKEAVGSNADYKVGVLLRGNAPAGTATTGYVQGMMQGYLFIAYTAKGSATPVTQFRIYPSTATFNTLSAYVNNTVSGLVPAIGQNVWYRASVTGSSPVSLKFEYSTDSTTWITAATASDASASRFTSGATQLVWGLGSPGFNFFLDDISYKAFSKIKLPVANIIYDGQPHAASGFAYGLSGESEVLSPELTYIYKDSLGNLLLGEPVAAGKYKVIASFAGNSLYLSARDSTTLTILPRALTVKAKDQIKECGGSLDLGSTAFEADGLAGNDGITSVTLTSAADGPGTYAIIPGHAEGTGLANYSITYVNGTLTVRDVTAPLITSTPVVPVLCYASNRLYRIPDLEAVDQCGTVSIRYIISGATTRSGNGADASGNFGAGVSTINWIVSDDQGNEATSTTTVTVSSPVTVSIPDVYAVNPSIDQVNTLYIGYGPTSLQLQAIANGGSAPYRYDWSTGQTSQTVSINTPGNYSVTVSDINGCTATSAIVIKSIDVSCGNNQDKVMICHNGKMICIASSAVQDHLDHGDYLGNCTVGMTTRSSQSEVEAGPLVQTRIYPNPAQDEITIQAGSEVPQIYQVAILDLSGKTVMQRQVNGQKSVVIPVKQLPSGLYLVQIKGGDKLMTFKIIKQ
jgi:glucuronoarabinoxylan endo-1,4-beta-xylanase